jgi:tRNA (guanine10-N2)-dimethyltransferase
LAYSKKCILILNSNNSCAEISSQTKSNLSNLIDEMYLKQLLKLSGLEKSTKPQSSFKISTLYLNQEPLQKFDVEQLASKVAKEYKYFKVNLKKPDIEFLAVLAKKAYFGATIWESSDNFDSRRADKRPAPHPTSMSPKLARAMINLASPNKEVLDPFCGSGGILLEGGIIGLNVIGIDIDKPMIERATLNLKYFHIKKFKLITDDSLKRPVSAECIVTDVPYGRSSKLDGTVIKLVSSFLQTYRSKTKKIVIACPDYIGMKKIAKKCGWTQEFKTSIYIHSNLTREIWVLRKSD